MGNQPSSNKPRVRLWVLACALVLGVAAVIAVKTGGFGLMDTSARTAQERCVTDVRGKLVSPATAKLSDLKSERSDLEPDSRDLFPLTTDQPLKGIEQSRITVWNVSGIVDAQTEAGSTIHDPFVCRAYFVDGELVDTLVVFEREH
ncbi:hypothetical protein A5792_03965 [Mycolicibacterium peregrinum]|uniref:Uncharacterized protein n=1 Tax=Mycolicibacterium peregrinum TaxID=43304 RepID=A0A1A0QW09_MYCPR|nr:hypothetical protein [Mycolicibacterium peregrinum]OBB26336.1 hypothetical protein A5792_03965 [Mycolicibacterium peregrinum]